MFDVNTILLTLNYISAKHNSGKTFTPAEYNLLLQTSQQQLFNKLYSDFEKKQVFTDALLPFKKFMGQEAYTDANGNLVPAIPPLFIDSNGYAPIPSDYVHYSAIQYKKVTNLPNCQLKISYRKIPPTTDQQFDAYKNSSTKRATLTYPICNFQSGFIRFAPESLQYANFVYLRKPVTPVYGGTIDPLTDTFIYSAALSTQLEWREPEIIELINILLSSIGINLSKVDLQQYAALATQQEAINNVK